MAKCRVVLTFPPSLIEQPITYRLVKDFDLAINILRAHVTPDEEGKLLIEIENGTEERLNAGIKFMEDHGITVELLEKEIHVNYDKCVHCGVCTGVCAPGALTMNTETWMLEFDADECVLCDLCLPACPEKAITITF